MLNKPSRYRDNAYLEFVRWHSCCECGKQGPNHPHHLSFIDGTGQGTKPNDLYTVPVCHQDHAKAHNEGGDKLHFAVTACRLLAEWIMRGEP